MGEANDDAAAKVQQNHLYNVISKSSPLRDSPFNAVQSTLRDHLARFLNQE